MLIFGTVGIDKDGQIPEDVVAQFEIAPSHIDDVLRAVGGGPHHIVKVQVFLTGVNDRTKINPLGESYFGALVEVSDLIAPALKVEIEAEAVID